MDSIAEKYNGEVVSTETLTPDLFIIKVKPDKPMEKFVPGQYVLLGLSSNLPRREGSPLEFKLSKPDRMVMRAYSIASSGLNPELLEFYISVVHNGSLTPRLVQLKTGDRIMIGEKVRGFFTLDTVPKNHTHVILAATGTGLAPYISMMRQHAVNPYPFSFLILHGAPHSWELGYLEELRTQAQKLPRLRYIPSITRTKVDLNWTGEKGRLTQYFQSNNLFDRMEVTLEPDKTSIFLCGNPAMIEEVSQLVVPKGYTLYSPQKPGSLHTEEYFSASVK